MRVLVLGARAPACLEWCRIFQAAGWHVTAADSLRWPVSRASRAVHRYVRLPEPRRNPDAWIAALRQVIESEAIDVVLPTCEEVFYLGFGKERLPCRVLTMDLAALTQFHHKYRFACLTQGWPVGSPETRLIESAADLAALAGDTQDWVFKPAYSRFAHRTLIRPDRTALSDIGIEVTPAHPWVAQRFVAGREHCSYSLLVDGKLTAHACYHPRYRVGRGAGIWFEPTRPAAVRTFVEHFGAATGYTGQVGFDFIESADGRCHVLECNPRATSGVHLFGDRPEALVASLLGTSAGEEKEDALLQPGPAPRMVGLAMLLFAASRHFWQGGFWRDFLAARDVVVRSGDWGPLTAQLPGLLEIVARAVALRRGLLAASTADIEWDGQPMEGRPCD